MNESTAIPLVEEKKLTFIPLEHLVFNDQNARKFDANQTAERSQKFEELVASIRIHGVIQPLLVRPIEGSEQFKVIAGERRARACIKIVSENQKSDPFMIPVVVKDCSDEEAEDLMLVENALREDLLPIEQSEGFRDYVQRRGGSMEAYAELSLKVSLPVQHLRRQVALLDLPQAILAKWRNEEITLGHVELFTRLGSEDDMLKALTEILSRHLTVKQFRDLLAAKAPPLAKALFDTQECLSCPHNTSTQGLLFTGLQDGAKCASPRCYEKKQQSAFEAKFNDSPVAKRLEVSGFRFLHQLGSFQPIPLAIEEPMPERCAACPECVTVVQLTGDVVAGKERTCVGHRDCFEAVFVAPAKEKAAAVMKNSPAKKKTPESAAPDASGKGQGKTSTPPTQKDPEAEARKSAKRAETYREDFLKDALPAHVVTVDPTTPPSVRFSLAALALANTSACKVLDETANGKESMRHIEKAQVVEMAMNLPEDRLLSTLQAMSLAVFRRDDFHASADAPARLAAAKGVGLDLAKEFTITRDYLNAMTKEQIVKTGEQERVALWTDPKIAALKEERFPKSGLMSLKKNELLDLVFDSGVDMKGRTPEEILS